MRNLFERRKNNKKFLMAWYTSAGNAIRKVKDWRGVQVSNRRACSVAISIAAGHWRPVDDFLPPSRAPLLVIFCRDWILSAGHPPRVIQQKEIQSKPTNYRTHTHMIHCWRWFIREIKNWKWSSRIAYSTNRCQKTRNLRVFVYTWKEIRAPSIRLRSRVFNYPATTDLRRADDVSVSRRHFVWEIPYEKLGTDALNDIGDLSVALVIDALCISSSQQFWLSPSSSRFYLLGIVSSSLCCYARCFSKHLQ